jgi:hypothetical protein
MVQLSTFVIREPNLIFGQNNKCVEPKGGLFLFGPYGRYISGEEVPIVADIGIIGTSKSIGDTINFFNYIKRRIPAESTGGIDFPGLGIAGKLHFDVKFDEQWQEVISSSDVSECRQIETREERINYFLDLLEEKIRNLHRKEPSPMLTICALPIEFIRMCRSPEQKGYHITIAHRRFEKGRISPPQLKGDYDLHNIIKVFGMKYEMPTQVTLPHTLNVDRKRGVQDLATRAWNLSMALYYKSEGVPWKLARLDPGTCYAGISFYRVLDSEGTPSMRASIAHLFLHTGECLVLTGQPFSWDDPSISPRLTEDQARSIGSQIIEGYTEIHEQKPSRLVIYKKSTFTSEEKEGFLGTEDSVRQTDLLTVKGCSIRWYRNGDWPVLRGTVIKCPGPEYLIFTLGFIQEMRTFPKPAIPIPIRVQPFNLDSTEIKMCREILSLSKLNWNNADFCDQFPVTLSVSQTISNILAETRACKINPSDQYRYYM